MWVMPVWKVFYEAITAVLATSPAQPRPFAWVTVVIAIIMILAIAVASCWNPRRGHRD